ncbi:cysteine desulfurase [Candidatus Bathyarchaeota archaeon]|nr:cysteine desulfurase [Candidatus Bathyarchaeota archaeon]
MRSVRGLIDLHRETEREVYLDSENSGLVFPEALEELLRAYRTAGYGNPSITHKVGWESYEAVYQASEGLSRILNASPVELAYTHGATEANNLAILGSAKANKTSRRKIITSSIEHLSVIFPAERLQERGYRIVKIPVDQDGFVDRDQLEMEADDNTFLVSIGAVNHEIGVIQDLRELAETVKDRDPFILFHTDMADALGRIRINLKELNVDLASFSSHKVYGPKGAGLLYVKEGVNLEPVIHGQLSSQRLWPGVENIPSIVGFAKAAEAMENLDKTKLIKLRDKLIEGITSRVEDVILNGPRGSGRAPDNVNISFLYVEGEALVVELSMRGIYASSGSACTSRILQPSHVLLAIGRRYEEAHGSLLMKVTPFHDEEDVDYVLRHVPEGVARLRSLSPIRRV